MRLVTLRGADRRSLTVSCHESLRAAMQVMNESGRTLILVTTGDRLEGVIADGDVRRYLARGGSVDEPVAAALNRAPITLPQDTPTDEVRAFMVRRGLDYLPLMDGAEVAALCVLEITARSTDLSAVILAGGVGSRLAPLTDSCPKPLLRLGSKPVLGHLIDHLRDNGVSRFVLAVNYLSHMIVDHFDDGSRMNAFIEYVHETKRLGTGGSLGLVDPHALSDPFLCLNGDVVTDVDVQALLTTHVTNEWDATMVVHSHTLPVPYGVVESGEDGRFLQIVEKPVLPFQINAGVYMLSKSVLAVVPKDELYDMPTLFDDLQARGLRAGTYAHHGRWIDIGTVSEFRRAQLIFEGTGDAP